MVQKWPILGDIPLIGQLFRQSASSRVKEELVIIVTTRILDDDQGGSFGYGYRAGTSASRQLRSPVPEIDQGISASAFRAIGARA